MVLPFVPTLSRGVCTEVSADNVVIATTPTFTTISFDDVNIDVDGMFDPDAPTVLKVNTPGAYLVIAHLTIHGVIADNEAIIRVRVTKPDGTTGSSSAGAKEAVGALYATPVWLLTAIGIDDEFSLEITLGTTDTADSVQFGMMRIA